MSRDTFKATLDAGIPVCKPGALSTIASQIRPHLQQGRRVYIRLKQQDHICVTLTGFPPEAVAHDWLGTQVELPPWTQSVINFMNI